MGRDDGAPGLSRRELLRNGAGVAGIVVGAGPLAGFLAACGDTSTTNGATEIGRGGRLMAAVSQQPDTLDPAKSGFSSSFEVFTNINDGLVAMDTKGNFVPRIATRWTQPDPRTWVFDLRDDVAFHNGDPVAAKDVKYSLDRILDKRIASPWAANLSAIDEVEVKSPTRVVLHLSQPYAPLLTILSRNAQIVSRRAIEDGDPARRPVGAGPFELTEWVQGDHITLRRNARYYRRDAPFLDEVRIRFMGASPSAIQAVSSRELNYLNAVPANLRTRVESDQTLRMTTSPSSGLPHFLGFNVDRAPLDDKRVRQAIAWAIDRDAIQKVAYFDAGEAGNVEVGSGSKWFTDSNPFKAGPDVAKARALMAQAGVTTPVRVECIITSALPTFVRAAEVMRDQLRPIGIDLTVNPLEPSIWLNRVLKGDFQASTFFNETVSDPDQMYSLMVLSDAELNLFNYKSAAADRLITKARAERDEGRRKELYAQVRELVLGDAPYINFHYDTFAVVTSADVLGATTRPTLELAFETIGFAKKSA